MAKIAQQDDLVIEITGGIADATDAQKQKLAQCVELNTILDVVLKTTTNGVARVIGYNIGATKTEICTVNAAAGTIVKLTVKGE